MSSNCRLHLCTASLTPPIPSLSQPYRYVHTLTKGAPDMANTFAKQHSLCKLAQSLKPYWSGSPASTPEAMVEWEECMSSLLEVASSVALMTDERDVLSVLDIDTYSSVTEVRTLALDFVGKSCWSRVSPPALSRVGFRGEVLLLFAQQCSCSKKTCTHSSRRTAVSHLPRPQRPVWQAIGAYLVRRPGVLQQYQDVGGACVRQHLLGPVRALAKHQKGSSTRE